MGKFSFQKVVWSPVEEEFLKVNESSMTLNQLTIQLAKSRAAIKRKLDEFAGKPTPGKKNKKSFIGKRPDLKNQYFRSSWEANVARWLNYKKIRWIYEPEVFIFDKFKTGTLTYCPDFYLLDEGIWLEVKGQLIPQGKTAIRRFQKFYPEEAKKLQAITGSPKTKATSFFTNEKINIPIYAFYNDLNKEFKDIIEFWE